MSCLVLFCLMSCSSAVCGQVDSHGLEKPPVHDLRADLPTAAGQLGLLDFPPGEDAQVDELAIGETDQADDPAGDDVSEGLVVAQVPSQSERSLNPFPMRDPSRSPLADSSRSLPLRC